MPGRGKGKCKGPDVNGESGMTQSKALRSWAPRKDSRSYSEYSWGCGRVLSKGRLLPGSGFKGSSGCWGSICWREVKWKQEVQFRNFNKDPGEEWWCRRGGQERSEFR